MVWFDKFLVIRVLLHAHETIDLGKDDLHNAVVIGIIGKLLIINLLCQLARGIGRVILIGAFKIRYDLKSYRTKVSHHSPTNDTVLL
jgi:hypothetical protein